MVEKRARGHDEESATPKPTASGHVPRPPAPTQPARLDRYMKQAADSMRRLSAYAGNVGGAISVKSSDEAPAPPARPAPAFTERQQQMIAAAMRNSVHIRNATEEEFADAARGNSTPERAVREGDFSAIPAFQSLGDSRMAGYASDIAGDWLPSIVGGDIASRMSLTPATLCSFSETDDMSAGQIFLELRMINSLGGYLIGTNAIIIPPEVLAYSEADALHVVLHELLHYASWLGGGGDIRWRDEDGNPRFKGTRPAWSISEGLTELIAQEVVRERGFEPSMIGYPAEVITCYYMEQLLGEGGRDLLRSAYLSGDFTEVRSRLDSAMGEGTFDTLIAKRDAAQALSYLTGRLDERGVDHSGWDASPIVAAARTKMEEAH